MPQMAPYNWLILFFLFNMIMMYYISYNHFNMMKFYSSQLKFSKSFNYTYTWMW